MTLSVSFTHRFDGLTVDVSFTAPIGLTALFGRSGAGKTTVVNAVAGLLRPDRGVIRAGDVTLLDTERGICLLPHRRRVGYVFQDARLFPHLTVRQNLLYGRWFAGRAPSVDLGQIVDLLGIGDLLTRRPTGLSGGEKSRVALGRALLSNPRLLLLDEPLAALDDARKAEILPYLERLRDEVNLPMLYVSHAMTEVTRLATTLVLIDKGRVTAAGPAARILSDPVLAPGIGLREAGALVQAIVAAHEEDGLTRLDSSAGPLWLPRIMAPVGGRVRVRILAQDVMLATRRPEGISALNILPAIVAEIRMGDGPGVIVSLRAGQETILARITRRSATALGLAIGLPVHAVLKAVSVAQENIVANAPPAPN